MFFLILCSLIPLLAFSSPIIDESPTADYIPKNHIFINESGMVIDEQVSVELENEVIVVDVPEHHDISASKTIYDKTSEWMMQAIPDRKQCLIMKRPAIMNEMNVTLDDVYKTKTGTTKEHPIQVNTENTIEIESRVMIGPVKGRDRLPKMFDKFQQYCPLDFDFHFAHSYQLGREDSYEWQDMEFENEEDFFENGSPIIVENHSRRKRQTVKRLNQVADQTLRCKMFGHITNTKDCYKVLEGECGAKGECVASNILYQCVPRGVVRSDGTDGNRSCSYLLIPCFTAMMQGHLPDSSNQNACILHMANTNEACHACCRDPDCRGGANSIRMCGDCITSRGC
jgi:hypothetical protein